MLSSTGSEESNYNSSSWSSPTTTPASPFSQATPRRTMEEVWKDINLASLSDSNNSLNNNPNFRNMTLQDFLARPFGNVVSPRPEHHHHHHTTRNSPPPPQAVMPSPATVLSLNHLSSDQFQLFCLENLNTSPIVNINHPNSSTVSDNSFSGAYPFEGLGNQSSPSSGLVMPSGFGVGKKRLPESDRSNFGGGDRRHKRMIKNRESAARSRARKQAYTNELELEVQHLMEENARLRRQQEQSSNAAASQLPKKHCLNRSSTAPF
ncbi:protein FD isoform X1 [Rosa chinensis]|uniref:protein FD isoform X1 n=1 Tax=Rosa chinensis TaxID=74649 RepID=UPI000D0942F5|nr:protein FD isoform X1 [Rosa chinensis]